MTTGSSIKNAPPGNEQLTCPGLPYDLSSRLLTIERCENPKERPE